MMMASCTRDLTPNPYTTVLKLMVENDS